MHAPEKREIVESIESKVKQQVERDVSNQLFLDYRDMPSVRCTSVIINGDTAEVYGTFSVRDVYKDEYQGKFNGTYTIKEKSDGETSITKQNLKMGTPTKSY